MAYSVEVSALPTINSVQVMWNIINETHTLICSTGRPSLGKRGRRKMELCGAETFGVWNTLNMLGLIYALRTNKN